MQVVQAATIPDWPLLLKRNDDAVDICDSQCPAAVDAYRLSPSLTAPAVRPVVRQHGPQLLPACMQVVLGITILYCALHVVFLGNSGMQDTDIPCSWWASHLEPGGISGYDACCFQCCALASCLAPCPGRSQAIAVRIC